MSSPHRVKHLQCKTYDTLVFLVIKLIKHTPDYTYAIELADEVLACLCRLLTQELVFGECFLGSRAQLC